MHTVFFTERLTAIELRDPIVDACEQVAAEADLHARFFQHQQSAFDKSKPGKPARIGNGNHTIFGVRFVRQSPEVPRRWRIYERFSEEVIGDICLRAPVNPDMGEYGGFRYNKSTELNEPPLTYSYVTLYSPSELGYNSTKDLHPRLFEISAAAIEATLGHPQLFQSLLINDNMGRQTDVFSIQPEMLE